MRIFLIIKNLFKSITYDLRKGCCFVAKILMKFYQKAVVFSETTYYYIRKVRMCSCFFVFIPKTVV